MVNKNKNSKMGKEEEEIQKLKRGLKNGEDGGYSPTTLLGATCAPLDHCFFIIFLKNILKKILICLSQKKFKILIILISLC